jgi:hypothetical protein
MKAKTIFLAFIALVLTLNSLGLSAVTALAAEEDRVLTQAIVFGKEYDIVLEGKVGFYTASSAMSGNLRMELITPDSTRAFKDTQMSFIQDWVDISLRDADGKVLTQVYGVMYLYFNLSEADRKLYDEGRLNIYRWVGDEDSKKDWELCATQIFMKNENKPHGRLVCAINKFDTYTMALQPERRSSIIDGQTMTQLLVFGREYDAYLGANGVYTPRSAFSGRLEMIQNIPNNTKPFTGMTFQGNWSDVRIYNNSNGKAFARAYGLIYVYFNLTPEQRSMYDKGKLSIYHWDEADAKWEVCPVVLFLKGENKPNGRMACVIKEFGLYTLAAKP